MARSATLGALPDELLVQVLNNVSFRERHTTLARVCRRWRQLVLQPELLRSITITLEARAPEEDSEGESEGWGYDGDPEQPILGVLGFFRWLRQRAAPHLERLSIGLGLLAVDDAVFDIENVESVALALCDALGACSRLQHLSISSLHDLELQLSDLAAPHLLRSLTITCHNPNAEDPVTALCVGGLAAATALERLFLVGRPLCLGGPALQAASALEPWNHPHPAAPDSLPRSLLSLALDGYVDDSFSLLPPELAALTRLTKLALGNLESESEEGGGEYDVLTCLTSLEVLQLTACTDLPDCLPRLSSLRALELTDCPKGVARGWAEPTDQLWAGLEALAPAQCQLSRLELGAVPDLPPTVSALASLQAFSWTERRPRNPVLPAGPWLAGMRRLALSSFVARSSLAVLTSATQLESLAILGPAGELSEGPAAELEVVAWAAQQPSLRRLAVSFGDRDDPPYWQPFHAGVAALQLPPALRLERGNARLE